MHSRGGYTLVELLVVLSISAMLTGLIITYNSSGRQQVALSVDSAKIAQAVSKAKSFAIATYDTGVARCGFGVRFNIPARQYSLVSYNAPDCRVLNSPPATTDIESFTLAPDVVFGPGVDQITEVYFLPPDPRTVLNIGGAMVSDRTGFVYLQTADGSGTRRVSVGVGGQITF